MREAGKRNIEGGEREGGEEADSLEWRGSIGQYELQGVHKVWQHKVDPSQILTKQPRGMEDDLSQDVTITRLVTYNAWEKRSHMMCPTVYFDFVN